MLLNMQKMGIHYRIRVYFNAGRNVDVMDKIFIFTVGLKMWQDIDLLSSQNSWTEFLSVFVLLSKNCLRKIYHFPIFLVKWKSLVHPFNEILLSDKKKWTTETCKKMNESQKHLLSERRQRERLYNVWFHVYEILEQEKLIYSDKKQISSCLLLEEWEDLGIGSFLEWWAYFLSWL